MIRLGYSDEWKQAKAEILGRFIMVKRTESPQEAASIFYAMGTCPFCDLADDKLEYDRTAFTPCDICKVKDWCKEWSDEDDLSKFKPERIEYYFEKLTEMEV